MRAHSLASEIKRSFKSIDKPKFASKLDPDSYTKSEYFTAMGALISMPEDLVRWMLPKVCCFLLESDSFESEEISDIVDFARFLDFEMKSAKDSDGKMLRAEKAAIFFPLNKAQASSILAFLPFLRELVLRDQKYSFYADDIDLAISAWRNRVEII